MEKDKRILHCPKCGKVMRKIGRDVEVYKGLGIIEYDMYCDDCDITIGIEDRSSYEQEGKIIITFT